MESKDTFSVASKKKSTKKWGDYDSDDDEKKQYPEEKVVSVSCTKSTIPSNHIITEDSALEG